MYFKSTRASSIAYQSLHSSIKETNWLIYEGICVLFFLVSLNIYYWEKLTFSKLVGKVNISERKIEDLH